jgi:hypothetical protein
MRYWLGVKNLAKSRDEEFFRKAMEGGFEKSAS